MAKRPKKKPAKPPTFRAEITAAFRARGRSTSREIAVTLGVEDRMSSLTSRVSELVGTGDLLMAGTIKCSVVGLPTKSYRFPSRRVADKHQAAVQVQHAAAQKKIGEDLPKELAARYASALAYFAEVATTRDKKKRKHVLALPSDVKDLIFWLHRKSL